MNSGSEKEIESLITDAMSRFAKEKLGEQAEVIVVQLIDNAIIVRFEGVLSPAEKHLVRDKIYGKLIKELKWKLIMQEKPLLEIMIKNLTGAEVVDIYSDIDLGTGERIGVFILDRQIEKPVENPTYA